jgi:hypothetical protein
MPQRLLRVRQSSGVAAVPASFPAEAGPFEFRPHSEALLLLNQTYLTTAFIELVSSGGKGTVISLSYAEALFNTPERRGEGNRNEIEQKQFIGYKDVFVCDGGKRPMHCQM